MSKRTLVHIVTYKESKHLRHCLKRLILIGDTDADIIVRDNASSQAWFDELAAEFPQVRFIRNEENLGFCAAHNQGAAECLKGNYAGMLILNPDVALNEHTLAELWSAIDQRKAHAATPLLLAADDSLEVSQPEKIDAAGMYFTKELRHFDRLSGQPIPKQLESQTVSGGTGACLLVTKEFISKATIVPKVGLEQLFSIYPQLRNNYAERVQLFDEAFFAYREDAELSLRAFLLGLQTVFVPNARAVHARGLKPLERTNAFLNLLGVKNRFLLQLNCVPFSFLFTGPLQRGLIRNLVVLCAVLLKERGSQQGVVEAWKLRRYALARRKRLFQLALEQNPDIFKKFASLFE